MKKLCICMGLVVIFGLNNCILSYGKSNQNEKLSQRIEYLEFKRVDIKDALRQLARQYNLNIIFSESVKGDITVWLQDVTMEEALDSIIKINGFVYFVDGEIINVTTPEETEREKRDTKVFRLNNADASILENNIAKMLSSGGTIDADLRSNSLIVTDTPQRINEIQKMLPNLDEVTPQVLIEAKFIETVLGKTGKLGIKWTIEATANGASRKTTFPFDPEGQESWIKKIVSPMRSDDESYVSPYGFPSVVGSNFVFGTLDFTQLQTVLGLISTDSDSKLISSPYVVTMDNEEAVVYIGKARPIPIFERNSDTGTYEITSFEEKIEGVTLTVLPQVSKNVNSKGEEAYYIRLKLKPKSSTFNENVLIGGFNYPIMSERSANTEVRVKDGQTIVIGGLIENKKMKIVTKVPFLGNVPVLGKLFTHKNIGPDSQTELLIFVTARVVKTESETFIPSESELIVRPERPFKLEIREVFK